MPQPSLFRKILPWLFVAVFFLCAPVLLLYTSGYRYNTKKNQVERNGTIILDSTPSNARIFLDGKMMSATTPTTLQNITPGWHHLRIEKADYTSWSKNLEIHAEQAVFANNIWLWKKISSPAPLVVGGPLTRLKADPLDRHLGFLMETSTSTQIGFWIPDLLSSSALIAVPPLSRATSSLAILSSLRWNDDGRYLIVGGTTLNEPAWWSGVEASSRHVQTLPSGLYRWSGKELVGSDLQAHYRLTPQTGAFSRTTIRDPLLLDEEGSYSLNRSTTTHSLVLTDRLLWNRFFSLPSGNWRFMERQRAFLLLHDQDRWLAINPQWYREPYAGRLTGDEPRWLPDAKIPTALFLNQNELWLWALGDEPTLLWRQSDPLIQAAWHRGGETVFVATSRTLFALDLDDRDGRLTTPIAAFDQIYDFTILDKVLYVAARKDDQRGLWKIEVE